LNQTSPALLSLMTLALAGCEPALVSFPADRGGRADLEALGLEVAPLDGAVQPGGQTGPAQDLFGVDWGSVRPDGGGNGADPVPALPEVGDDCTAVVRQTGWCATLRDSTGPGVSVTFVGLDDGATCAPLTAQVAGTVASVGSLALQGTILAWCDASSVVHEVELGTGRVITTANPALACEGLTSAAGGFALLPQGQGHDITWYPRVGSMATGEGAVEWGFRPEANRIAADSQLVYTALQTTDSIRRWTPDGTELETLTLDDSPLIRGMDAAPGNRLVLLDDQRDLAVYDRITGAQTASIPLDGAFSGLACFPEP
jgi:hypothetical protein